METVELGVRGAAGVGKSALLRRFAQRRFDLRSSQPEQCSRPVSIEGQRPVNVCCRCCDLSSMRQAACATVLVYDIGDRESFKAAVRWLQDSAGARQRQPPVVLVGNKADESQKRTVALRAGMDAALDTGAVAFLEVSAESGANIDAAFCEAARAGQSWALNQSDKTSCSLASNMANSLEGLGFSSSVAKQTLSKFGPVQESDGLAVMELAMAAQWTLNDGSSAPSRLPAAQIVDHLLTFGVQESVAKQAAKRSKGDSIVAMDLALCLGWSGA